MTFAKTSSCWLKHLDTVHDLTVLNLRRFPRCNSKVLEEGSNRGFSVGFLIVGDFEH